MLPITHILHPTDFSESSSGGLQMACALARDYSARLRGRAGSAEGRVSGDHGEKARGRLVMARQEKERRAPMHIITILLVVLIVLSLGGWGYGRAYPGEQGVNPLFNLLGLLGLI